MDDSFIWNHQSETNSWFLGLILHDPIPQSESVRVVPMIQKRMTAAILFTCLLGIGEIHSQETSSQFKRLDRNQDGKLTKDEFSGPLFNRIDTNNDGVVSAEEDQAFTRCRPASGRGQASKVPESVQAELDIPYAGTSNFNGLISISPRLGMTTRRCRSLSLFTVAAGKMGISVGATG